MFELRIEMANEAFEGDGGRDEVARILHTLADRIENGSEQSGGLYDINGNRVGTYEFVKGA